MILLQLFKLAQRSSFNNYTLAFPVSGTQAKVVVRGPIGALPEMGAGRLRSLKEARTNADKVCHSTASSLMENNPSERSLQLCCEGKQSGQECVPVKGSTGLVFICTTHFLQ